MQWHLDRIDRYNGVYGAIETVFRDDALAEAARQDADAAAPGSAAPRGALWGVPIVDQGEHQHQGPGHHRRLGGFHAAPATNSSRRGTRRSSPGSRPPAPIIVGHTNMPDLANSDTNRSTSFGRTGNAYDVRFSPGGSSGGTVTAVAANFAVLGNGTDTGNSIRMPAATSALVGVYPTRGLVSIAGIAPLDWLLDNTGPIARTTTDAAIALAVMAGEDPLDPRDGRLAPALAQRRPAFEPHLQGRRAEGQAVRRCRRSFSPARACRSTAFRRACRRRAAERFRTAANMPLRPETREMFMKAVEALRAAGAEVVVDDTILPAALCAHRQPGRDLCLHAGRHRPVPRHVRPGRSTTPPPTT